MSDEDLEWSHYDFTLGRQSQPAVVSARDLTERVRLLRGERDAYVELARASRPYPLLAVSLRGPFGVLHGFRSDASLGLLVAPSSVSDVPMWMPVCDTNTSFSPEFIHRRADACAAVERFIECADLRELGSWESL